ncbi:unnamed protein product, partial [Prunus brigantina]
IFYRIHLYATKYHLFRPFLFPPCLQLHKARCSREGEPPLAYHLEPQHRLHRQVGHQPWAQGFGDFHRTAQLLAKGLPEMMVLMLDLKEYNALIHCFGQNPELRVNSTKSIIAHLLGAAGTVEAVVPLQVTYVIYILPNFIFWSMVQPAYDDKDSSDEDVGEAFAGDDDGGMDYGIMRSLEEQHFDFAEVGFALDKMSITPKDSLHSRHYDGLRGLWQADDE